MEGPSLYLAAEQLASFIGKEILALEGNTKIEKEVLVNKIIISIFSYGKYLFFQFDHFALRVHFLLYGTFEAIIQSKKVTGDYLKKKQQPRLALTLKNGKISMYNCSLVFIESEDAQALCDFSIDIMSSFWDEKKALKKLKEFQNEEIGDVLLDQSLFMGVGNIIKNETLLLAKVHPEKKIQELSLLEIKKILKIVRRYVFQFYEWRKSFVLRKHFQIYRQKFCKCCHSKVIRKITGKKKRISFICPCCEHI